MKRLIIIILSVAASVALLYALLLLSLTSDSRIAENPDKIARAAHFNLPAYTVLSREDNFDRTAGAWSFVDWVLQADSLLTDKTSSSLEHLASDEGSDWTYNPDKCMYSYESEDDETEIHIEVNAGDGQIYLSYSWRDALF